MWCGRRPTTFQRNVLPPSSGSKSKSTKNPAGCRCQVEYLKTSNLMSRVLFVHCRRQYSFTHLPNVRKNFKIWLEWKYLQIVDKLKNNLIAYFCNPLLQFHVHSITESQRRFWMSNAFTYIPFMAAFPSLLTVSSVSLFRYTILLHFSFLPQVGVTDLFCFITDSDVSSICTVMLLWLSSMIVEFGLPRRMTNH